MNWTKTTTGYATDGYTLTRTAGGRWIVTAGGTTLNDGKQVSTLKLAKEVCEDHANYVRDMTLQNDVVLGVNQPIPVPEDVLPPITAFAAPANPTPVLVPSPTPDAPIPEGTPVLVPSPVPEPVPDDDRDDTDLEPAPAQPPVPPPGYEPPLAPNDRTNLRATMERLVMYRDMGFRDRAARLIAMRRKAG